MQNTWIHSVYEKLNYKFKVTTNSKHKYLIVANVLNRICSYRTVKTWVSDINYIKVYNGFIFNTVSYGYRQEKLGWSLSDGLIVKQTFLAAECCQ
jgi:hypothetical protein